MSPELLIQRLSALFKAEDKFGGDKRSAEVTHVVTIGLTGIFAGIPQSLTV